MVLGSDGCVVARYYLNVFPDVGGPRPLGAIRRGPKRLPARRCPALVRGGVPELQPLAAAAAGIGR
jgi:hypothetical protein